MSCINKSHPWYKELVTLLGEEGVQREFVRHGMTLPNPNLYKPTSDEMTQGIMNSKNDYSYSVTVGKNFEGKKELLEKFNIKRVGSHYYYVLTPEEQKRVDSYISKRGKFGGTASGFVLSDDNRGKVTYKIIKNIPYLLIDIREFFERGGINVPTYIGSVKVPIKVIGTDEEKQYIDSVKNNKPHIPLLEKEIRREYLKVKGISAPRSANYYLLQLKSILVDTFNNFTGKDISFEDLNELSQEEVDRIYSELGIENAVKETVKELEDYLDSLDKDQLIAEVMDLYRPHFEESDLKNLENLLKYLPEKFIKLVTFEYIDIAQASFAYPSALEGTKFSTLAGIKDALNLKGALRLNVALSMMYKEGKISLEQIEKVNELIRPDIEGWVLARQVVADKKKLDKLKSKIIRKTKTLKSVLTDEQGNMLDVYLDLAEGEILDEAIKRNSGLTHLAFLISNNIPSFNSIFSHVRLGNIAEGDVPFTIDQTIIAAHELGHALDYYMSASHPEIKKKIYDFITDLIDEEAFQTYMETGVFARGYNKLNKAEIAADLFAFIIARASGYDVSNSHLADLNNFFDGINKDLIQSLYNKHFSNLPDSVSNPIFIAGLNLEEFGLEPNTISVKGTNSIFELIRKIIDSLKKLANSIIGRDYFATEEKESDFDWKVVKNPFSVGKFLDFLETIALDESNFNTEKLLQYDALEFLLGSNIQNDGIGSAQKMLEALQARNYVTKKKFQGEYWVRGTTEDPVTGKKVLIDQEVIVDKLNYINQTYVNKLGFIPIVIEKKGNGYTVKIQYPEEPFMTPAQTSVEANDLLNTLSTKFDTSYKIITREEAAEILARNDQGSKLAGKSLPQAFFMNGEVHIVEGYLDRDTLIEEFLHPFVNAIYMKNPELFDSLHSSALNVELAIVNQVHAAYTDERGFTGEDRALEIVTKVMTKYYSQESKANPQTTPKDFLSYIYRFLQEIAKLVNDIIGKKVYARSLPLGMTYRDLAKLINTSELKFEAIDIPGKVQPKLQEAQVQTIAKFQKMASEYDALVFDAKGQAKTDRDYVTVSDLIGSTFQGEQKSIFEIYRKFGIDLHSIVEAIAKGKLEPNQALSYFTETLAEGKIQGFEEDFITEEQARIIYTHLVSLVSELRARGNKLLTEAKVVGKAKDGRNVIGRADIISIAPDGSAVIFDFKAKRVYKVDDASQFYGTPYHLNVDESPLADPDFKNSTYTRNTFEGWSLQTTMYNHIMSSKGINVTGQEIIPFMYKVTDDGKKIAELQLYYDGVSSYTDQAKDWANKYFEKQELDEEIKNIEYFITDEQLDDITNNLSERIKERRAQIEKELKEKEDDKEVTEALKDERIILSRISNVLKNFTKNDQKFASIIQNITDSLERYLSQAKVIYNSNDSTQNKAYRLEKINAMTIGIMSIVSAVEEIATANNIDTASEFYNYIGKIKNFASNIDNLYKLNGSKALVEILKEALPESAKTQLSASVEKTLREEKKRLEATLVGERKVGTIGKLFGRGKKESITKRIAEIDAKLAGIPLDDKRLMDMISVFKSGYHVGKDTPLSRFFTAINSSEPILALPTKNLKNKFLDASLNFQKSIQVSHIQDSFEEYKKGKAQNEVTLSEPITETVTVKFFTEEGIDEKQQLRLVSPVTVEYENTITEYRQKIYDLRRKRTDAKDNIEKRAISEQLGAVIKEYNLWQRQHAQRPYLDEVYDVDNKLTNITLAWLEDWRGRRASVMDILNGKEDTWSDTDFDALDDLQNEYKKAKSLYDEKGNKKTGDDLEIAQSLRAYNEEIMRLYDFRVNTRYFEIMSLFKKTQYEQGTITKKQYEFWLKRNTYRKVKQEFWDRYFDLIERINAILGSHQELNIDVDGVSMPIGDALKIVNELKSYKRDEDGEVNPDDFTPEAVDKINLINDLVDEAKKLNRVDFSFLSEGEQATLKELFQELRELGSKKYSKYYKERIDSYTATIDNAWGDYKQGKIDIKKFRQIESNFAEWYNENHKNAYVSKEIRGDNPLKLDPRDIWLQFSPNNKKKWTYDAPTSKYTIRTVKKEFENPEYTEFLNGMPQPKFLIEGQGSYYILYDSPYLNAKFKNMSKQDRQFYDVLRNYFFDLQKQTTRRNLGFTIPGYYRQGLEAISQEGVFGGIRTIARERLASFKSKEQSDEIYGYQTNTGYIRLKGNTPLELADQSKNAIGSILRWASEAHINIEMAKVAPSFKSALDYLRHQLNEIEKVEGKESKRAKDMERIVRQVDEEFRKYVYGEFYDLGDYKEITKVVDNLLHFAGKVRMFANIPNHMVNVLSGNVQAAIVATGEDFSEKNLWWAGKTFWGTLVPALSRDYRKIGNKTLWSQLYERYNPLGRGAERFFDNATLSNLRSIHEEGHVNFLKDKGEMQIASTVWLAMFDKKQVYTTDGKAIPLAEAYELGQDGLLKIKDDVLFTREDEREFIHEVQGVIRKTQGNYAKQDSTSISRQAWGRALEFFKKYFLPLFKNRFSPWAVSYEEKEVLKGFYRSFVDNILDSGVRETVKSLFTSKTSLTALQREANIKVAREVMAGSAFLILGLMLRAAVADEDDDDAKKIFVQNIAYILGRVGFETNQFDPLPFLGGLDNYTQTFNSFTISANTLKSGVTILTTGTAWGMAQIFPDWDWMQKKAYYQKDSGFFDEGDAKVTKQFFELTGISNIISMLNPEQGLNRIFR